MKKIFNDSDGLQFFDTFSQINTQKNYKHDVCKQWEKSLNKTVNEPLIQLYKLSIKDNYQQHERIINQFLIIEDEYL